MTVKIISGHGYYGGSTTAHISMTNYFNSKGIETIFYSPHTYPQSHCKADLLNNLVLRPTDVLIFHFYNPPWQTRPPVHKMVYACHEKDICVIKNSINYKVFDKIQYLNVGQKEYQDLDYPHFIVPNFLDELKESKSKGSDIAGIIGTIDRNKQVPLSIKRALQDGRNKVLVYGNVSDTVHFDNDVRPLIDNKKVFYMKHEDDKQKVYDSIGHVYHSSISECLSYVKRECQQTGVVFHGSPATEREEDYPVMSNEEIFEIWKRELEL